MLPITEGRALDIRARPFQCSPINLHTTVQAFQHSRSSKVLELLLRTSSDKKRMAKNYDFSLRNHKKVLSSPSSRPTSGTNPRSLRAFEMSE